MKFLLIFFLFPLQLFSQDITGVWTGTIYSDTTKQYINYELAVSEYEGRLSGYSHTIFVIDSVENTGVKSIKIKKSGNDFFVEDDRLIYNNYTEPPAKGVKTFSKLTFSQNDSVMVLSGTWNTNQTRFYKKLTGIIYLKKKNDFTNTLIIKKLDSLQLTQSLSFMPKQVNKADKEIAASLDHKPIHDYNLKDKAERSIPVSENKKSNKKPVVVKKSPSSFKQKKEDKKLDKNIPESKTESTQPVQPAAEVLTRKIESVKTVTIKSDTLLLTLYDNGEIDGDTVSVLLNGKVIMPMQGLTAKGTSKTIYLTPEMGDSITLIMYAENLGSIPPNTGLLVVHDGQDIYEIRFSGDLQKNSAIVLKRKKKIT